MTDMLNARMAAYKRLHGDNPADYMAFVRKMKGMYNGNEPLADADDQADFTAFIEDYVEDQLKGTGT